MTNNEIFRKNYVATSYPSNFIDVRIAIHISKLIDFV